MARSLHVSVRSLVTLLLAVVMSIALAAVAPLAQAGTVGVTARIQGAGSVSSSAGGPYSCSKTTNQDERVTVNCDRQSFEAVFEASVTLVPTAASIPSGQWSFVEWQGCDSVVGTSCTVHSGAFSLDERFPKAVFADGSPPTVTSDGETFGDRSATFFFHSNEPADWSCKLDTGTTQPCGTNATFPAGKSYSSLSEGSHSFSVQATDPSGQTSTTLQRTVTIVDTAITDGPSGLSGRTTSFSYSTVAGNAFECSLDFGAFVACGTGTTGTRAVTASDGQHTFRVRAVNGGATDAVPASRTWTVDGTAPVVSIGSGPADGSSAEGDSAAFGFSANEAVSYQCRLYPAASPAPEFGACTGPTSHSASGLAPGTYRFDVKAVDAASNAATTGRTFTLTAAPGGGEPGGTPGTGTPGTGTPGTGTPGTATPGTATPPDTVAPLMGLPRKALVARRGAFSVKVSCPASETGGCTGRLTVKSKKAIASATRKRKVTFGSAPFALAPGQSKTLKLRLSRANKRLLKRLRKVAVTVTAVAKDGAGNTGTATRALTLKNR